MYKKLIDPQQITGGFFPHGILNNLYNVDIRCLIEESQSASGGDGKVGDGVGGGGAGGW